RWEGMPPRALMKRFEDAARTQGLQATRVMIEGRPGAQARWLADDYHLEAEVEGMEMYRRDLTAADKAGPANEPPPPVPDAVLVRRLPPASRSEAMDQAVARDGLRGSTYLPVTLRQAVDPVAPRALPRPYFQVV